MEWNKSAKQTEAGEVPFYYTQLSQLRDEVSPDPLPPLQLSDKVKMITVSREYETDIITLFHATGDFNYRSQWQEGVKRVEEIAHFLPLVGMRCRCIRENGEVVTYASSYFYQPDRIEFSETDEKKKSSTFYILEKIANKKTKLTLDYYLEKNWIIEILFNLTRKKKMEDELHQSVVNLDGVVKEIKLPV